MLLLLHPQHHSRYFFCVCVARPFHVVVDCFAIAQRTGKLLIWRPSTKDKLLFFSFHEKIKKIKF
jgi:hypothetical protein